MVFNRPAGEKKAVRPHQEPGLRSLSRVLKMRGKPDIGFGEPENKPQNQSGPHRPFRTGSNDQAQYPDILQFHLGHHIFKFPFFQPSFFALGIDGKAVGLVEKTGSGPDRTLRRTRSPCIGPFFPGRSCPGTKPGWASEIRMPRGSWKLRDSTSPARWTERVALMVKCSASLSIPKAKGGSNATLGRG